jgi:hypothetical protein
MNHNNKSRIVLLLGLLLAAPVQVTASNLKGWNSNTKNRLLQNNKMELCCLCEDCSYAINGRGDMPMNQYGKTCNELVLEMSDNENDSTYGSDQCDRLYSRHHDRCCNPDHDPVDIEQVAAPNTPSGGGNFGNGPYKTCNLCKDNSYPGKESTMVAVLDQATGQKIQGVNTCRDLYWFSKKGNLEEKMCNPTRNYFQDPCGCGEGSGGGGDGGGGGVGGDYDWGSMFGSFK